MDTKKVIVALDTTDLNKIKYLTENLKNLISIFKIGMQIFTKYGIDIVKRIQDKGYNIFLDLKFFDIPNTVEKAVQSAIENDIFMLTLHILGGKEMLERAMNIKKVSNKKIPYILGVTILTSFDSNSLKLLKINEDLESYVLHLAKLGKEAGLDGFICSPKEITLLRNEIGRNFLLVTPGIRKEITNDDQKRTLTPIEAINKGADYIVVGRPVLESKDPKKYIETIFL